MKMFLRVTKLSNISGRADYITDKKRQENIVSQSSPIDWKPYQEYEKANRKSDIKNNEGREVIIALPNEWAKLHDLPAKAQKLAVTTVGKNSDIQWAVHWNKSHTNLHMHVVFSERHRIHEVGRYNHDVYLTDGGKVARRKADRAKDVNGKDKPPIHRKGDSKGGFSVKDIRYKSKAWVHEIKTAIKQDLEEYGVVIDPPELIKQYHEGNGEEAVKIHKKNELIKIANPLLENAQRNFDISSETMKIVVRNAIIKINQGLIPAVRKDESGLIIISLTPKKYDELVQKAHLQIEKMKARLVDKEIKKETSATFRNRSKHR